MRQLRCSLPNCVAAGKCVAKPIDIIIAAVNAADRLGLTAEQLNAGAIEKLVKAARSAKAAIWDSHYGRGLDIAYTKSVDDELTAALRPFQEVRDAKAE